MAEMQKEKIRMRIKPNEVKKLVLKFAKQGKSASVVGMVLRDEYGIPDIKKLTGLSVTKILEEQKHKTPLPDDLRALIKKSLELKAHLEDNRHDMPAKRSLAKTEARVRSLVAYFKKQGKLDKDWKYEPDRIKLLIN
jgi:small subunit ribosomal protein S15